MTDYLDPLDYVPEQYVNEQLETALEDPFAVNFRSNRAEEVGVSTEDPLIRSARVDRANRNVEIQYNPQSVEEKYVVLMKGAGLGIVESHANIPTGEYSSATTVSYHVVTPEIGLMYDGQGYVETANRLPRQAARKAPELLEKAEELAEAGFSTASELEPSDEEVRKTRTVPPPHKDPLFDD